MKCYVSQVLRTQGCRHNRCIFRWNALAVCRTLFALRDVCLTFVWYLPGAGLCSQAETIAWREGLQIKNRWIAGWAYRCWDCPRDGKFCESFISIRQEPALLLVVGGQYRSGKHLAVANYASLCLIYMMTLASDFRSETHPAVASRVSLYLNSTEWLLEALTDDGIDHGVQQCDSGFENQRCPFL